MTDSTDANDPQKKEEENNRKGLLLLLLLLLLVFTIIAIFIVKALKDADKNGEGDDGTAAAADGGVTAGDSGGPDPEPEPAPKPEPEDEFAKLTQGDINDDQSIVDFICRFVESGEDNGPRAELSFFAEKVDSYFDKPDYDKEKILKDREAYIARWPERSYKCIGGSKVVARLDGGVVLATAKFEYTVKNGEREASGTGEAFYKIRERGDRLEIYWIGEKLED